MNPFTCKTCGNVLSLCICSLKPDFTPPPLPLCDLKLKPIGTFDRASREITAPGYDFDKKTCNPFGKIPDSAFSLDIGGFLRERDTSSSLPGFPQLLCHRCGAVTALCRCQFSAELPAPLIPLYDPMLNWQGAVDPVTRLISAPGRAIDRKEVDLFGRISGTGLHIDVCGFVRPFEFPGLPGPQYYEAP